jgi:hypothetical protein
MPVPLGANISLAIPRRVGLIVAIILHQAKPAMPVPLGANISLAIPRRVGLIVAIILHQIKPVIVVTLGASISEAFARISRGPSRVKEADLLDKQLAPSSRRSSLLR